MSFEFEYPKTITEEENQKIAERLADAVSRVCDNMQANHTAERVVMADRGQEVAMIDEIHKSSVLKDVDDDILIDEEDVINSPSHYQLEGLDIEVIDVIVAVLNEEELRGYLRGNVIKYMLRADKKGGIEDYLKAEKYLGWLIDLT